MPVVAFLHRMASAAAFVESGLTIVLGKREWARQPADETQREKARVSCRSPVLVPEAQRLPVKSVP